MVFSNVYKLFFVGVLLLSGNIMSGQCVSFARNIAKPMLEPFVHDGNYNATYMEEGESAELYKTFFKDEEYRLVVASVENLPQLRIRVLDENRQVVFDNAEHNFTNIWEFKSESTNNMIVHIKVPDKGGDTLAGGCVAILFGIKPAGRRR
jgi:hypothetical protein